MIFVILWHFVHLSLEETIGNSKSEFRYFSSDLYLTFFEALNRV